MFKMGWRHKSVVIGCYFPCVKAENIPNVWKVLISSQWALYPVKLHFKNESKTFQISKQFIPEDLDFPTF